MTPQDDLEAFKHLHRSTVPDEAALEAMSRDQIAEYLKEEGIDLPQLRARMADRRKKFAGKYALMLAAQKRKKAGAGAPVMAVPATREGIIAAFEAKFGDKMPMAARKYRTADYEELKQLYVDLMSEASSEQDAQ